MATSNNPKKRDNGTRNLVIGMVALVVVVAVAVSFGDRKSTRLNSSHVSESRMPSSA